MIAVKHFFFLHATVERLDFSVFSFLFFFIFNFFSLKLELQFFS